MESAGGRGCRECLLRAGDKDGGAVAAVPGRTKPRSRDGKRRSLASSLGPPPVSLLIFGLGWRRLAYFFFAKSNG